MRLLTLHTHTHTHITHSTHMCSCTVTTTYAWPFVMLLLCLLIRLFTFFVISSPECCRPALSYVNCLNMCIHMYACMYIHAHAAHTDAPKLFLFIYVRVLVMCIVDRPLSSSHSSPSPLPSYRFASVRFALIFGPLALDKESTTKKKCC